MDRGLSRYDDKFNLPVEFPITIVIMLSFICSHATTIEWVSIWFSQTIELDLGDFE